MSPYSVSLEMGWGVSTGVASYCSAASYFGEETPILVDHPYYLL